MKKSLDIDADLLAKAKAASGAASDAEAVRLGLESVVRHAAYQRAAELIGSARDLLEPARRRESSITKRKAS